MSVKDGNLLHTLYWYFAEIHLKILSGIFTKVQSCSKRYLLIYVREIFIMFKNQCILTYM